MLLLSQKKLDTEQFFIDLFHFVPSLLSICHFATVFHLSEQDECSIYENRPLFGDNKPIVKFFFIIVEGIVFIEDEQSILFMIYQETLCEYKSCVTYEILHFVIDKKFIYLTLGYSRLVHALFTYCYYRLIVLTQLLNIKKTGTMFDDSQKL